MPLRVGIAEVDYTPSVGLPLMGNLRKDYTSKGVHDPLFAKAVVFEDPDKMKVALLAVDICMLSREQVALMRKHIASQCDISVENILVAANHIHSGPATLSLYSMPKSENEQIEAFLKVAAGAVLIANKNLKNAEICVGYNNEDRLSFYRRLRCKDGKAHMNWENLDPEFVAVPLGEIDPQVCVVSIGYAGKPVAAIVNFALHPAVLDYGNDLYSSEYPGYLAEAMRKTYTQDFKTLFFNGCCGNINHIDYKDSSNPRRGYAAIQRIGYMLAASAGEAMNNSIPVKDDKIAISREFVSLERLKIDKKTYQWSLDALVRLKNNPPEGREDGLPKEYSAETWINMYEQQDVEDRVEVMVIRIGEIGIVGLPGEAFCEFGKEIKKKSPARFTIVIELSNDAIGYIPTPEAFDQGGYEVTAGATRYEQDTGTRLTAAALNHLNKLFSSA